MQVDVIAQWNHDGSIVPLRLRIYEDEMVRDVLRGQYLLRADVGVEG